MVVISFSFDVYIIADNVGIVKGFCSEKIIYFSGVERAYALSTRRRKCTLIYSIW